MSARIARLFGVPGFRRSVCGTIIGCLLWMPPVLRAAAFYEPERNTIRVVDYPESAPCTPALLLSLDRRQGWNKIAVDPTQALYTVNADLVIGNNDGSETFFQIGTPASPRETMLVRGNVVVYPHYLEGVNHKPKQSESAPGRNRLTLGSGANSNITAMLLIDSRRETPRTLYVGCLPPSASARGLPGVGGEIQVWNSTITAARTERENALGCPGARQGGTPGVFLGLTPVLSNATISRADGYILNSLKINALVQNCTFSDSRVGFYNCASEVIVAGCVFKNLDTVVLDGGSMVLTMRNCVFTNAACNCSLAYTHRGLTLIDCEVGPPRKGDHFTCWENPQTKKKQYPKLIVRRHLIVRVTDPAGAPVSNAVVSVANEQNDIDQADNLRTVTDAQGRTPGRGSVPAILLTENILQATDIPDQPRLNEYTYSLKVQAPGYQDGVRRGFKPTSNWQEINISLGK